MRPGSASIFRYFGRARCSFALSSAACARYAPFPPFLRISRDTTDASRPIRMAMSSWLSFSAIPRDISSLSHNVSLGTATFLSRVRRTSHISRSITRTVRSCRMHSLPRRSIARTGCDQGVQDPQILSRLSGQLRRPRRRPYPRARTSTRLAPATPARWESTATIARWTRSCLISSVSVMRSSPASPTS